MRAKKLNKNRTVFISVLIFIAFLIGIYSKNIHNYVRRLNFVSPTPALRTNETLQEMQKRIQESYKRDRDSEKFSQICLEALTKSPERNTPSENFGTVSGKVYWPSGGYPSGIAVCAYNLEQKNRNCTAELQGSADIKSYLLTLNPGRHYIYVLAFDNSMIGIGSPGKGDDYRRIKDDQGHELGVAPLITKIEAGSNIANLDVGDDVFSENLYCPELY